MLLMQIQNQKEGLTRSDLLWSRPPARAGGVLLFDRFSSFFNQIFLDLILSIILKNDYKSHHTLRICFYCGYLWVIVSGKLFWIDELNILISGLAIKQYKSGKGFGLLTCHGRIQRFIWRNYCISESKYLRNCHVVFIQQLNDLWIALRYVIA